MKPDLPGGLSMWKLGEDGSVVNAPIYEVRGQGVSAHSVKRMVNKGVGKIRVSHQGGSTILPL